MDASVAPCFLTVRRFEEKSTLHRSSRAGRLKMSRSNIAKLLFLGPICSYGSLQDRPRYLSEYASEEES